jgi:hypothetical protein
MNAIVRTDASKWSGNAPPKPKRAAASTEERLVEELAGAEKCPLKAA